MNHSCILFLWHQNDDVTRHHFERFRVFNPGVPVVPLSFGTGRNDKDESRNASRLVFDWFRSGQRTVAERYFTFEWDTLCKESVKVFYRSCWDSPAAAASIYTRESFPDWGHFGKTGTHGFVPQSGVMLGFETMQKCAELIQEPVYEPLHSECAVGTVVANAGVKAVEIFPNAHHFISCNPVAVDREAGIWHAVKELRL